jgi:K+-sensing histidine kinase KdpD
LALLEEIILSKRQTGQLVENIFWLFAKKDDNPYAQLERADLNRLIGRDVMPIFHRDVQYKQLELDIDLDPDLPDVEMDVPGIGMVLRNLIQIVINQTPPGGGLKLATYVQEAYAVFSIENMTTTLDAECLESLFAQSNVAGSQPRFRSPTTFGLYLCQKILDACHGELGLETDPGQGSAFLMKLPIPPTGN